MLLLLPAGQQALGQAAVPLDVNGDGLAEFVNKTSGSPQFGGVWAWVDPVGEVHQENAFTKARVEPGTTVDGSSEWSLGTGASEVGYYGIRFWSATGTHYGWLETYNPILNGLPSFVGGGWTRRAYFNPEPGQPIKVGDVSLVLRVQLNPANGKLRIRWNTDASTFATGVRLQSRSLQPGSTWKTDQTIGSGFEAEVALSADARIFQVIQ